MKNKKNVPLVHNQSKKFSVYFDFEKNLLYVQQLIGRAAKAEPYSKSNTFWLTWIIMGSASFLGLLLDQMFTLSLVISMVLALILGAALAKILIKVYVINSLGKREYKKFTSSEVITLISNRKRFWLIKGTYIVLTIGMMLVIMIRLLDGGFRGKDFIMFIVGSFGIVFLHDTENPFKASKARKILKKQLKAGKFDD
ncbi:hypothetical protein [Lactovum odontotermitis]